MIVIATHNSPSLCDQLLNSLVQFRTSGDEVLVVDTQSEDADSLRYLAMLPDRKLPFKHRVTQTPYRKFATGAWWWAYHQFPSDYYIFLHDSTVVIQPDWHELFTSRLVFPEGISPWCTFHPLLLGSVPEEIAVVRDTYGLYDTPDFGFFGCIFAASYGAMRKIDDAGYSHFLPSRKVEECGMERIWSIAAHRLGIPVNPVMPGGYTHEMQGPTIGLRKIIARRQ